MLASIATNKAESTLQASHIADSCLSFFEVDRDLAAKSV